MTGPVWWESNPNNGLKNPPQHNRTYDLDPWIYKLLDSSHHLLNDTNPSLAEDCWLCLSPIFSPVLATPINFNLNSSYKKSPPSPMCLWWYPSSPPLLPKPTGVARSVGKIPKELCNKTTPVTAPSFSLQCSPHSGNFFVCRTTAYACLPPEWKGICTLPSWLRKSVLSLTTNLSLFP
jgi:hypothetical protein